MLDSVSPLSSHLGSLPSPTSSKRILIEATTDSITTPDLLTPSAVSLLSSTIPLPYHKDSPDNGGDRSAPASSDDPSATIRYTSEPSPALTKVEERLKTFADWPNDQVSPKSLAEGGFYYTGVADIVRCPYCGAEGYQWVRGDDPLADHARWKPQCRFLQERRSAAGNGQQQQQQVATLVGGGATAGTTRAEPLGYDTCGSRMNHVEIFPKSVPEDEVSKLERVAVKKLQNGPAHKDYVMLDSRLKSFADWPKSLRQKPAELAEAGFFYLGTGDQTLCFNCGGGLKDWDHDDEPWEQHAVWFPNCTFLLNKKGLEFVKQVQEGRDDTNPASDATHDPTSDLANAFHASNTKDNRCEVPSTSDNTGNENNDRLCKICYKNEMGAVLLPCRHIVACVDCSIALNTCAVCRKPVEATVRVYLS